MRALVLVVGLLMAASSFAYENVFYCTYQNQTCVDSSAEMSATEEEVSKLVELVGAGQENFLGFVDSDGTTIQFFADDVDDILVEIPDVEKKGSYGKKINQSEMRSIVKDLAPPYLNYIKSLDLKLKSW